MDEATQHVEVTVREGIATIRLNRPDRMNALTRPMVAAIIDALDRLEADDAVRAVIFTGAGRAFCAGADLGSGSGTFDYERRNGAGFDGADDPDRDRGGLLTLRLFDFLKPVIAAVNGAAAGIGATMQLPMDIRIASTDARFGFVFARRGIVPEAASSWFLPRLVGISTALDWCYSGRMVSADEALARGLVRDLHPPERLLDAAHELAISLTGDSAPVSVALTRQMMWRMLTAGHPMEAHRIDSRAMVARGKSADAREGIQAFIEKRPAHFPETVSGDLPDVFPHWRDPTF
ncbi:crotonase/enoyl-CoA hydratase family protein [Sphingomonas sp.]|uniref:crotonase/enoyl-CoA hydratase family protein n=1 Tax=Sphingomonas sp. TaxID=28214 RepID=UPI001ED1FC2B|nr:crotonase/enoyl-CoA hydratase family protein [Sphingomonas sp.]MBX3595043.1 crotonase/enoyl-CoA hydratase family protein [Sphingomonas sp.]